MKKFFIVWCVVLFVAVLMGIVACAETYPTTFVVINTHDNIVSMENYNGDVWEWEGVEDWTYGDIVSVIMDDNNTAIIYDDTIIMMRYSGTICE